MGRLSCAVACLAVASGLAVQAQEVSPSPPERLTFGEHPSVVVGPLKFDLTARIESDLRAPTSSMGRVDSDFAWGTRRAGVEGTWRKRVSFQLERDFAATGAWRDAYIDVRVSKAFEVEAGRFKIPFGREALTATANRDFIFRSRTASDLSPGRDSGLMAHGRLFRKRLEYRAGYFSGDGDHSHSAQTVGGQDAVAGRAVVTPWAASSVKALSSLHLAAALTRSQVERHVGLRGRTALADGVFFDRVFVNGARWRTGLDAAWSTGPLSATAEYVSVTDERKAMGFDNADLPGIHARSWYVAGTWVLTGERKHGRVEPRRGFGAHGAGAIEVTARLERISFNVADERATSIAFASATALQPNSDRIATVGVNWYLNHYLKAQFNVVQESVADRWRSPAPLANGRFTSAIARFQLLL